MSEIDDRWQLARSITREIEIGGPGDLNRIGAALGINRMAGETDAELRERLHDLVCKRAEAGVPLFAFTPIAVTTETVGVQRPSAEAWPEIRTLVFDLLTGPASGIWTNVPEETVAAYQAASITPEEIAAAKWDPDRDRRPRLHPDEPRTVGVDPVEWTWASLAATAPATRSSSDCTACGGRLFYSARQRGDGLCGPCSRAAAAPAGTRRGIIAALTALPDVTNVWIRDAESYPVSTAPGEINVHVFGGHNESIARALLAAVPIGVVTIGDRGMLVEGIHVRWTTMDPKMAALLDGQRPDEPVDSFIARVAATAPAAVMCEGCDAQVANIDLLDCTMRCTACRARVGLPPIAATAPPVAEPAATPPPAYFAGRLPADPLDAVIDGLTLREMLARDEHDRREPGYVTCHRKATTPAQRAAVSAHWSAELRAKVEAGKRADAERATSVLVDVDPEDA